MNNNFIVDVTNPLSSPALTDCMPQQSSQIVRVCAVCGDTPAKLHYGVLACFGCKGFFRRAVKEGRNKYICRYEKQCKVDKYERNSCRYCRFRRCLQVGMNPDSVRPDRSETNNGKKAKNKALDSFKSIHTPSHFRLSRQDSGRVVTSEESHKEDGQNNQSELVSALLSLEEHCVRNCRTQSRESVRNFTLKSLINERLLTITEQNRPVFEDHDISVHALWRIVQVVDWVNGICSMALSEHPTNDGITVEDKIAIVQNVFSRITLLQLCGNTVLEKDNKDLSILRTFFHSEPDNDLVFNSAREDVARPLKKTGTSPTELILLQAILTADPAIKGIRPAASDILLQFRNILQDLLVDFIKRSHSGISPYAHYGNLLLLVPRILTISDRIYSVLQQSFPLSATLPEPPHYEICQSLANPDTTDYLRFPQHNRKYFTLEKPEVQIQKPIPSQSWQSFAHAFSGIQTPLAYHARTGNLSLMSALSPQSQPSPFYTSASIFPNQPLPEPPHGSSAFLTIPAPPLTITAPTPPPTVTVMSQCLPYNTPPSETESNNNTVLQSSSAQPSPIRHLNLEVPTPQPINNNGRVYKLPLQLTKSIEEMLKPPGQTPDEANWNKPLNMDWVDIQVSTPAFNKEVVKFFPECVTQNNS